MEVYDTANQLASEIKRSSQFQNYKNYKEKVFNNPETKKQIEEFENLKQELQIAEIKKSSEGSEDKKMQLIKLYNELIQNEEIKQFFEYELQFNELMIDINKILGDVVKELM